MWQPVRRPSHTRSQNVPNFGTTCLKPLRFMGFNPDPAEELTTLPRPHNREELLAFGNRSLSPFDLLARSDRHPIFYLKFSLPSSPYSIPGSAPPSRPT